jgi:N-carbamoylputrescine amidase
MNAPERVTLGAVQTAFTDDPARNRARLEELVRAAHAAGAQIVVLPELHDGHYFCRHQRPEDFERALPVADHPTIRHFQSLAAELGIVLPVSFFERDIQHYYNSVAIIDADGSMLGVYRKSHIPSGPGYQEKFFFRPGDTGFAAWNTRHGCIGVGICWDQWFPEAARAMTLLGADVLLYPTAIGSEPEAPEMDTRDPWQRVMIGHAVANVVAVAAANRVGQEEDMRFYGSSFIADERGDKRAELDRVEEGVITASIELAAMRRERANWGFFRDRRPELYDRPRPPHRC